MRNFGVLTMVGLAAVAVVLCCVAGCRGIHPLESAAAPRVAVKIAIMPRYGPQSMARRYMPLVKYLRAETGYDITYVSAMCYRDFLGAIERTGADFAFASPIAYVTLHKTQAARPLLVALEPDFAGGPPQPAYRGVILARADSGIAGITDLKGKVIASALKMSLAGYIAPQVLARERGLDLTKEATVAVCPSQEQVIERLCSGRAAAGFLRESVWEEALESGSACANIAPVGYTMLLPGWCVSEMGDTDPVVVQTVKRALLGLDWDNPAHRTILRECGLRGFAETSDQQYEPVRRLLERAEIPY